MQTLGTKYALWLWLLHVSPVSSFSLFRSKDVPPQEGQVRLAGSDSISEGRVEIYHDGRWGSVCDDEWDLADAGVVCRQLHFPGAQSVGIGGAYGEGSGPIWLDDMQCEGTEKFLSSCSFKGWAVTDCRHKEDAGVICESGTINDTTHSLDHSIGLSDELGRLFDSGESCDFLIISESLTGNQDENGTSEVSSTTVCAHKMIVSRFPGFNATEGASSISVHLSQACQPHLTSFIRYVYTRKIEVSISSAQCVHQMASVFGAKKVMEEVGRLFVKFLPEDVTFHTQVSFHEYSRETGDLVLQENCLQYLAWNYQNLTSSPAWSHLSAELLGALLSRSDLVVPNESFLLLSLESWVSQMGNSTSLESQTALLGHIRFPMITAEELFNLQFTSTLYKTHYSLFRDKLLRGFQVNALPFSTLKNSSTFQGQDFDCQPRIYTDQPWSTAIASTDITEIVQVAPPISYAHRNRYGHNYQRYIPTARSPYSRSRSWFFSTPAHGSAIFKNNIIRWEANVLSSQRDCSDRGLSCESLPAARLRAETSLSQYQNGIRFGNRLLLMCQGAFIAHIQDFKEDMTYLSAEGSKGPTYPCPNNQYGYWFVVRPEYI